MTVYVQTMSNRSISLSLLGVRVDRITRQQVVDAVDEMIAQRRTHGNQLSCQQVVTVNVEFVMAAQQNALFRDCINNAALVVPDGMGVVWAARYILHQPVPERVTGIDTVVELAKLCARKGYRLYLLGAASGIAELAAQRLLVLAPGLQVAGTYAGSPAATEEEDILERMKTADVDIVCVAYGAPAQDLWIQRNLSRLPAAVAIGVGGAYDFLSGRQKRAPLLMQRMGLEWLYRLYREPWRWRRMLALPRFALRVLFARKKEE